MLLNDRENVEMPSYKAPVRDMQFVLHEVLKIGEFDYPQFNELDQDLINGIVKEGARFSEQVLAPLNLSGDREGCTRNQDGTVSTPNGFRGAYASLIESGWTTLVHDTEYGGQNMPRVLGTAVNEMLASANTAFSTYQGLTGGAIEAISIGGTDEQKKIYLPKMVSGEWAGTMDLTEPHCGTDLGMLKTRAEPQADGSYQITGQKIFISGGDHDLTENIIHLVLARTPDAPQGVKGISLFIVPKLLESEGEGAGRINGVSCGAIEEKMGLHGSATCVMNYDAAQGYLLGEVNKGLNIMFVMMNVARVGVGMQSLAQSEVAYQNAALYAADRLQGRAITGPTNPEGPGDPIIVHPDVRRMLMESRTYNEGSRMLVYWASLQGDLEGTAERSQAERDCSSDLLGLITPVVKGYLSDIALKRTVDCQQVFGGHGYIEEWGMSQFVRDTRIAALYEGANGIQALDLVGRKLAMNSGRALMTLNAQLDVFIAENNDNEAIFDFVSAVESARGKLTDGTMWIMQNGAVDPNNVAAGSVDYMHMMGLLALAFMWGKMASVAQAQIDAGNEDEFYTNKLITGRYFIRRVLPLIDTHLALLKTGAEPVMALSDQAF